MNSIGKLILSKEEKVRKYKEVDLDNNFLNPKDEVLFWNLKSMHFRVSKCKREILTEEM